MMSKMVCAYDYNGVLYRTEEEVLKAQKRHKRDVEEGIRKRVVQKLMDSADNYSIRERNLSLYGHEAERLEQLYFSRGVEFGMRMIAEHWKELEHIIKNKPKLVKIGEGEYRVADE